MYIYIYIYIYIKLIKCYIISHSPKKSHINQVKWVVLILTGKKQGMGSISYISSQSNMETTFRSNFLPQIVQCFPFPHAYWYLGFPCGLTGKESTCNSGHSGSIPGLGRFSGEGKGYPHQYCGLENSVDCIVHGITKSWTWLSDFHWYFRAMLIKSKRACNFLPAFS